jgi:hypothetical protein
VAQFRVTIDNGRVRITDASTGEYVGGISVEKWKNLGLSTDKRHMALDITAAAVAGNGSRKHTVDPSSPVVTFAEYKAKTRPITLTEERGHVFLIARDTKAKGSLRGDCLHG